MTVLHRGFDTLTLAVKASIGTSFYETLHEAKDRAEKERREVQVDYRGITLLLKSHGGAGYAFIASGGKDGANWAFKKPNAKDPWGIRVTFGSFFLAMYGLGSAKAHFEHTLDSLGIRYTCVDISISRADYCVDILAPTFVLKPENFVMHSNTARRDHVTDTDQRISGKSGRVTSVTIGQTTNRQVIVYNKTDEVITKRKLHWFEIWNDTLRKCPEYSGKVLFCTGRETHANTREDDETSRNIQQKHTVWRVEFRAGKNLLKDRWNIRTWEDFFDRFGDCCREMGEVIKYTKPSQTDPNRARWPMHPLWKLACSEIKDDLFELQSGAEPNPIKEVEREEHIALILRNILGCSITVAALEGAEREDLPKAIDTIATKLKAKMQADPKRSAKQLQDAKERYVFMAHVGKTHH